MQLKKGTLLKNGQYTIVRTLGIGGFGITYLAMTNEQVKGKLGGFNVQVPVAVKEFFVSDRCQRNVETNAVVIPETGGTDRIELYKRKFIKEAHSMASLHHKHIVPVSDVFEDNNTVYYAMQYLEGGSLRDRVDEDGPLDEQTAKKYVLQIAEALSYMHTEQNICHLDVKPGNIMLDKNDNAVLIDFGIAKRYDAHGEESTVTPVGISKGYSPLEQYNGTLHDFSPQTDVYGLAATLFYLLTGETPPDANTILEQKGLGQKPERISSHTWDIISKAMQPARTDRIANMGELINLLKQPESSNQPETNTNTNLRTDDSTIIPDNRETKEDTPKPSVTSKHTHVVSHTSSKNKWLFISAVVALIVVVFFLAKGVSGFPTSITRSLPSIIKKEKRDTVNKYRWKDMVYTGTLRHGVPDGKGKAIYDDGRIYEGIFSKGQRTDKNARFVYTNKLVFKGCFTADTIQHGRVDTPDGELYFVGDFSDGRPYNGFWYLSESNQKFLEIINGKENRK